MIRKGPQSPDLRHGDSHKLKLVSTGQRWFDLACWTYQKFSATTLPPSVRMSWHLSRAASFLFLHRIFAESQRIDSHRHLVRPEEPARWAFNEVRSRLYLRFAPKIVASEQSRILGRRYSTESVRLQLNRSESRDFIRPRDRHTGNKSRRRLKCFADNCRNHSTGKWQICIEISS